MAPKKEGPDQARSWIIAFAACFIYVLVSGIHRTTGLFYVAIIETYGVSRLQANLPFTMRNVVKNLAGPLVGAVGQRYGARDVTIVGGVLASLGIILCTFAPNVLWITILWGGMHGLGVALGSTLSQVIVPQYFLKYRATASGFALSGPCFGSFFLPILLEYMLTKLGLAGTFLVTGGLVMHVLPASFLMVEPPWIPRKTVEDKSGLKVQSPEKTNNLYMSNMDHHKNLNGSTDDFKDNSVHNLKMISTLNNKDTNGTFLNTDGIDNPAFIGSRMDLTEIKSNQVQAVPIPQERLRTVSLGDVSITKAITYDAQETSLSTGILKMLRNPMFYLISLSLASFAMVVDPVLTVIIDYLMDKGLKEDVAKYFISMMSLGDLIGRMGFGWVTDRNYISVPKFMMLLHVGLGLCFLLLQVFNSFNSLMTILVIYGLISGAILVMFPILIGKYLRSVQSLAIGFVTFFSGLLTFGIPPLIGYFRDRVGSYDGMFYITGISSMVVGFVWLFEPLFMRLNRRLIRKQIPIIIISPS